MESVARRRINLAQAQTTAGRRRGHCGGRVPRSVGYRARSVLTTFALSDSLFDEGLALAFGNITLFEDDFEELLGFLLGDDGVTCESFLLSRFLGIIKFFFGHLVCINKVLQGSLDLRGLYLPVVVAMLVEACTELSHRLEPGSFGGGGGALELDAGDGEGEEGSDE